MENKNINSFSENVDKLINSTNTVISALTGLNETIIADEDIVNIKLEEETIQLPSYQNVLNRLKKVEKTVETFTAGTGSIKTTDGTNREIKVETLPTAPKKIINISSPTNFKSDANWFFENLLFPKLVVSIDLTNNVEEDSDRVYISRVIITLNDDTRIFYENNILDKNLTYDELISLLNENNISYYEDIDTLYFPLKMEKYKGEFIIKNIELKDGKQWYYLDNINYTYIEKNSSHTNLTLGINSQLRLNNTLFTINQINTNNNSVLMSANLGMITPTIGDVLYYYETPTQYKNIEIPVGIDEINCIYFKGVNERYNLISNEWSDCATFISNDLTNEDNETLKIFYQKYVADFGAEWISQAKEKKVPAYSGITPNIPVLTASDFKVVQINKQINASFDKNELDNLTQQISTLKSSINSSRNTIAKLKTNLTTTTLVKERYNLQNLITNEALLLSTNTSEYKSLVNELEGYIKKNSVVKVTPKYRIRGFFPIPQPKIIYDDKNNEISKQEVIGFDIKYRYIKNDETGVDLGTYTYTDGSSYINAVFSDWIIISSALKEKVYNNKSDVFEWKEENVGDGNVININQLDIPINEGEKVEIMVRSISEAGYPDCPLKSDWSNSIIIDFPNDLTSNNKITNLLDDVKSDSTSIKLDEVLNTAGFYSHISDEIISPDDSTQMYHHNADNIAIKISKTDDKNNEIVNTNSLTYIMKEILNRLDKLESKLGSGDVNKISIIESKLENMEVETKKISDIESKIEHIIDTKIE